MRFVIALARQFLVEAGRTDGIEASVIDAVEPLLVGLAEGDWVETASGAVRLALLVIEQQLPACATPNSEACLAATKGPRTLFSLISAVGNFASTFADGADPAKAAEARQQIIEELIDRMTNRTERHTGVVVSLGGALGALGGIRTDFYDGIQVAGPAVLGIGIGLQTYHESVGGFHMMLSAFDLGQ